MKINKIYNEDCFDTMKRMENKSIDYVLTSPPYNIRYNQMYGKDVKKYKKYKDKLSSDEYFKQQQYLINELLRVTKKHVFYNIQMLSGNKLSLCKLIGYFADRIKEVIIWNKRYGVPAIERGVFNSAFEFIIIFSNDSPEKRKFYDVKFKGTQQNVFEILNSHFNKYAEVHKAVMPLDIPRYFMINFGGDNDIWYDPYSGTGTTAVASIMENKQYLGSEISKEYYDLSYKRLEPYLIQTKLF